MLVRKLYKSCLFFATIYFSVAKPYYYNKNAKNSLENVRKPPTWYARPGIKDLRHTPFQYKQVFKVNVPVKPSLFKHLHNKKQKNKIHIKRHLTYGPRNHVPFFKTLRMYRTSHTFDDDKYGPKGTAGYPTTKNPITFREVPISYHFYPRQTRGPTKSADQVENKAATIRPSSKTPDTTYQPVTSKDAVSVTTPKADYAVSELFRTNSFIDWRNGHRYSSGSNTSNNTGNERILAWHDPVVSHIPTNGINADRGKYLPKYTFIAARNSTDGGSADTRNSEEETSYNKRCEKKFSSDSISGKAMFREINRKLENKTEIEKATSRGVKYEMYLAEPTIGKNYNTTMIKKKGMFIVYPKQ